MFSYSFRAVSSISRYRFSNPETISGSGPCGCRHPFRKWTISCTSACIFFIPGTVWFVLYAGFQIPQYMGKAFLMICSIIIKGNIMVMDKDPLIVFCNRTLYSFVSLFLAGKVQGFSARCCTDIYLAALSVFPGICTIRMHNRGKQHICIGRPAFRLSF